MVRQYWIQAVQVVSHSGLGPVNWFGNWLFITKMENLQRYPSRWMLQDWRLQKNQLKDVATVLVDPWSASVLLAFPLLFHLRTSVHDVHVWTVHTNDRAGHSLWYLGKLCSRQDAAGLLLLAASSNDSFATWRGYQNSQVRSVTNVYCRVLGAQQPVNILQRSWRVSYMVERSGASSSPSSATSAEPTANKEAGRYTPKSRLSSGWHRLVDCHHSAL